MPRRTSIPRKTKYEVVPANRITHRFSLKLIKGGKQNLAERILRQALARAEAQAGRPGLEILEAALRDAVMGSGDEAKGGSSSAEPDEPGPSRP